MVVRWTCYTDDLRGGGVSGETGPVAGLDLNYDTSSRADYLIPRERSDRGILFAITRLGEDPSLRSG